ncbi:hypothetical protein CS8_057090 [Cupriavidus sp. 8B]
MQVLQQTFLGVRTIEPGVRHDRTRQAVLLIKLVQPGRLGHLLVAATLGLDMDSRNHANAPGRNPIVNRQEVPAQCPVVSEEEALWVVVLL